VGRHSVEVLLRIYAKCIDGQDAIAKRRIAEALRRTATGRPRNFATYSRQRPRTTA
jgi:hypothetical protein